MRKNTSGSFMTVIEPRPDPLAPKRPTPARRVEAKAAKTKPKAKAKAAKPKGRKRASPPPPTDASDGTAATRPKKPEARSQKRLKEPRDDSFAHDPEVERLIHEYGEGLAGYVEDQVVGRDGEDFKLAGLLAALQADRDLLPEEYRRAGGFEDWSERVLRWKRKKTFAFAKIYRVFRRAGLDAEYFSRLGWSRAEKAATVGPEKLREHADQILEMSDDAADRDEFARQIDEHFKGRVQRQDEMTEQLVIKLRGQAQCRHVRNLVWRAGVMAMRDGNLQKFPSVAAVVEYALTQWDMADPDIPRNLSVHPNQDLPCHKLVGLSRAEMREMLRNPVDVEADTFVDDDEAIDPPDRDGEDDER